ncbi:MAG: hypothetical protein D3916_13375 [Candidatus Electrothrix sp. MAN1_4]|nr:hypothetical protein [Candidatus Electrothrix sp. MAN1_4]
MNRFGKEKKPEFGGKDSGKAAKTFTERGTGSLHTRKKTKYTLKERAQGHDRSGTCLDFIKG